MRRSRGRGGRIVRRVRCWPTCRRQQWSRVRPAFFFQTQLEHLIRDAQLDIATLAAERYRLRAENRPQDTARGVSPARD